MNSDVVSETDQEDRPLTREDIERLVRKVGSPNKLRLSGRNLRGIELSGFDLSRAVLRGANLSEAKLSEANLRGANLRGADLSEANLSSADLSEANLIRADLSGADLSGVDLNRAVLIGAVLSEANLSSADLRGADLREANLRGADLRGADFSEADLSEANFNETLLSGAIFTNAISSEDEREQLQGRGIIGLQGPGEETVESPAMLLIRIVEEPLTARNLATIISALVSLHTKCRLIATYRFADLMLYTQTKHARFEEESPLVVTKLAHNSPAEIKLNASLEGVAKALETAIDAVVGMWDRKRELVLKNTALEEEIAQKKRAAESDDAKRQIENQKALLELYEQQIELRKKQLDLMDYAVEKAPKIVEMLAPEADAQTKAMAATALVKDLLLLGEGKGLELVLPVPQKSGEQA